MPVSVAKHFIGSNSELIIQPMAEPAPDFVCYRIVSNLIRVSRQREIELFHIALNSFMSDLNPADSHTSGIPEDLTL